MDAKNMHVILPKSDRLKAVNCSINSNLYLFNAVDNNVNDNQFAIDISYTPKFKDTFADKSVDVIAEIPPRISLGVENGVNSGDDLYVVLTAACPKDQNDKVMNLYAGIRNPSVSNYAAFAHSDANSADYDSWFCILKAKAEPFTISIAVDSGKTFTNTVSLSSLGIYSEDSWNRMQQAALLQMYQRHVNDTIDPEVRYVDSSLQREITHVADPTRSDSAATKNYVDSKLGTVDSQIKILKPEILFDDFLPDKTGQNSSDNNFSSAINSIKNSWPLVDTLVVNGGIYLINDTIQIPPYVHVIFKNTPIIKYAGSGTAIDIKWTSDVPTILQDRNDYRVNSQQWQRCPILSGGVYLYSLDKGNTIGISLGSHSPDDRIFGTNWYNVARSEFNDVHVKNFHIGLSLGAYDVFLDSFNHLNIEKCDIAVLLGNSETLHSGNNAGENIVFKDCVLSGSSYAILLAYGGIDTYFVHCGIDFNTTVLGIATDYPNNMMSFDSCNIEGSKYLSRNYTNFSQLDSWRCNLILSNNMILMAQDVNTTDEPITGAVKATLRDNAITGTISTEWIVNKNITSTNNNSNIYNRRDYSYFVSPNDNLIPNGFDFSKMVAGALTTMTKNATTDDKWSKYGITTIYSNDSSDNKILQTARCRVYPGQHITMRTYAKYQTPKSNLTMEIRFYSGDTVIGVIGGVHASYTASSDVQLSGTRSYVVPAGATDASYIINTATDDTNSPVEIGAVYMMCK
jgi:hypothetical protein